MEPSGIRYRVSVEPSTATAAPTPTAAAASASPDRAPSTLSRGPQITGSDDLFWPSIASKDDIPPWLRDNDYILHGHPMPTASYRRSYRLWRCLHMETMNIWTHALGSATFVAAAFTLLRPALEFEMEHVPPGDRWVFGVFFGTCALAFGLSANFHTLRSHSYTVHHLWGRLDILGICLLAFGGGFSATYYAFYDDSTLRYVYWGLNAAAALAAAVTLFDTGGGGSKMRALRGCVFSALTLSAMVPIVQRSIQIGWEEGCRQIGAHYLLAEGAVLVLGVTFFVGRMPERFLPGAFDIWGHSHQLWHICAVIGMMFHGMALVSGYRYQHGGRT